MSHREHYVPINRRDQYTKVREDLNTRDDMVDMIRDVMGIPSTSIESPINEGPNDTMGGLMMQHDNF